MPTTAEFYMLPGGKTRKSIGPFFEQLRPEGCARIEALAMDMNTAFDLEDEQQVHLDEVLAANKSILTAYVMQELLKTLWTATSAWDWRERWKQWMAHAKQSDIPAPQHFARRLKPYWRGIVSRVRWPMHTGQLEGINNRINVIKRIAYGYRDSDYFVLKIKAAFPGNP